jgi:hypothetical protein
VGDAPCVFPISRVRDSIKGKQICHINIQKFLSLISPIKQSKLASSIFIGCTKYREKGVLQKISGNLEKAKLAFDFLPCERLLTGHASEEKILANLHSVDHLLRGWFFTGG